ncbi:MAG: hypothetical protein IPH10_11380 [bacterium]|nr:hypothetical protein [bacterium]
MRKFSMIIVVLAVLKLAAPSIATELYFQPDSSFGLIGDTVTVSAYITASDTVRGFTVYLYYDTTLVDLAAAPVPGSLISSVPGLDFRFADHIVSAPNWLEVGATIFGGTYWAGPGELFRLRLVYRGCGDVPMNADVELWRPNGSYIPGTFNPPVFLICDRVPQAPDSLTIQLTGSAAELHWRAVMFDTLGRALIEPPLYRVYRSTIAPIPGPYAAIDSTPSLFYLDVNAHADQSEYRVDAHGQ